MTTQATGFVGWRVCGCRFVLGLGLVLAGFTLRAADEKFDVLQTENGVYTNVTVLTKTRTDIFIQHAGGVANVKLKDLDDKILTQLGYQVAPKKQPMKPLTVPTQLITNVTHQLEANPQFQALEQKWQTEIQSKLPPISKGLILGVLAGLFVGYLFFCYCCMLIVRKTGNRAGLLIWLPILKVIPLFRAAGMPAWWVLVWLSPAIVNAVAIPYLRDGGVRPWWFILAIFPVANLVASVVWIFKIVASRGKNPIWAVLLLLPVTNLIAFLYLAFSNGEERQRFHATPPPLAKAA
jgi:hypothetical protein